jgi:hypothetical protein
MVRLQLSLFAAGVLCLSGLRADDKPKEADDLIASALTKAKEDFQEAVKGAGEKLLTAFTDQQKKLEENTKLKVAEQIKLVEQLQEERKAFEADPSKLPKSPGMKVAVSDYQMKTDAAKKKCEAAFDKAAEGYRGKKDLASAKAVLTEKEQFFKGGLAATDTRLSWKGTLSSVVFIRGREWNELPNQGGKIVFKEVARTEKYYSGPRKLDRRLSYSGGPGKGNRWRARGRATRRRSRPRSPWRP